MIRDAEHALTEDELRIMIGRVAAQARAEPTPMSRQLYDEIARAWPKFADFKFPPLGASE